MVPARLAREAPGVDHQQVGQKGLPAQHAGVDRHARRRRRQPQGHNAEQGEQVQRIDPGDARPQEAAIAEALLAEGLQIDVAEDEARQDEEQLDPQIPLGDQGGGDQGGGYQGRQAVDRQIGPQQIDHHPQGGEEPQGGQGAKIDRRRDGRHRASCHGGAPGTAPAFAATGVASPAPASPYSTRPLSPTRAMATEAAAQPVRVSPPISTRAARG
ncbi:hypothetical protein D3C77_389850 [compost metagenome]